MEINKISLSLMDHRIGKLPTQFDNIQEILDKSSKGIKSLKEIQTRRLQSDHVLVNFYRNVFDARKPDDTLVWRKNIEQQDPNYAFKGQ